MKILLVQDFLRNGGTERQSILLANAFAQAGHAASLLTFRPGGPLAATVAPAVLHSSLQPLDLGWDWFAPGLARRVRRSAPDITLCMGRMANCYAGWIQRHAPDTAVIATMRTGKPLPRLFRQSLIAVRHVVANSRDARDTLVQQHAVPPTQVSVIYNSLVFPSASREPILGAASSSHGELRRQFGATDATTVMLCVAMFRPEKNQRELIEIVAGLSQDLDWQLWLAGEGPERSSCERLVAARKLESRVKFLGFHADPSAPYREADLAVHASWSEALSNFLIEAQAHGLPAIAYQAQGIPECFIPSRTGWVIARDDRAAFQATLRHRLAETSTPRRAAAASARAFARETFDPHRQVQTYLELFARFRKQDRP